MTYKASLTYFLACLFIALSGTVFCGCGDRDKSKATGTTLSSGNGGGSSGQSQVITVTIRNQAGFAIVAIESTVGLFTTIPDGQSDTLTTSSGATISTQDTLGFSQGPSFTNVQDGETLTVNIF